LNGTIPRIFTGLCLIATLACVSAGTTKISNEIRKETPKSIRTIRIWVQDHPELSAQETLAACNYWAPEGIQCILAPVPSPRFIRILVDLEPCKAEKDGSNMLAYSGNYGVVKVNLECMHKWAGKPIHRDTYRVAIAHEIGHQLGIWCHVADEHGLALMNNMEHKELLGITPLDHEAYTFRDQNAAHQTTDDPHRDCIRQSQI
jgi:hypothetical protein